jgi:hypothetical protein
MAYRLQSAWVHGEQGHAQGTSGPASPTSQPAVHVRPRAHDGCHEEEEPATGASQLEVGEDCGSVSGEGFLLLNEGAHKPGASNNKGRNMLCC